MGSEPLVPKLRFPEFRDAPGWERSPLVNLAAFVNEKVPVTSIAVENYVSTENLLPDYGGVSTASKLPAAGSVTRYSSGDVLISNIRPYLKKVWRADRGGGASNDVIILRSKGALSETYLSLLLANDAFITYLARGAKGVKMPRGDVDSMRAYPIPYPEPAEQQKIADCLTSLDELIAAEGRKLEALRAHKKGLMQNLFPREGETTPRLRFPEFRDGQDWKPLLLSELMKRVVKPTSVDPDVAYREIGIRSHGKGLFHKEPVLGRQLGDKRVFWVVPDAFIVNIVFGWEQAIAVTSSAEAGMIASHRFPMYEGNYGRCDVDFMKYFFLTSRGKELLWIASPGGAGRNKTLGQREFENLKILAPEDIEEQRLVASCLTSADLQIAAQADKLQTLKSHKQGLMQGLFPSSEAAQA
jgi:type I restriction enzyme, S subunit